MKKALLRYVAVVVLAIATSLLSILYYQSSLYGGGNIEPAKLPVGKDIINMLLFASLFIGAKYLIYDGLVQFFTRRGRTKNTTIIFYLAYAVALYMDLWAIFASFTPISDAGFAVLASIIYTPPILIVSLVVIGILASKTKQAGSPANSQTTRP
jgi:hypothetical protein